MQNNRYNITVVRLPLVWVNIMGDAYIVHSCCCTVRSRYYPRLMIAEVSGTAEQTAPFMKYGEKPGAHIATNVALTNIKKDCGAACIRQLVNDWIDVASQDDVWSNWQVLHLLFLT